MDDKAIQKYQSALKSLQRLKDMKMSLKRRRKEAKCSTERDAFQAASDMLQKIETRVSGMMERAKSASMEIDSAKKRIVRPATPTERGLGDMVSKLGSFVGKMGKAVVETSGTVVNLAGSAVEGTTKTVVQSSVEIAKSAVPITKSVLHTAVDVAKTTYDSAQNVADTITKSITDTAASMTIAAQNTSSSILNQTSNLVSSLTNTATSTIDKIGAKAGKTVSQTVDSILNPSGKNGVNSLVSSATRAASSMISSSTSAVSSLLGSTSGIASGIMSSASSSVESMVSSACSLANTLTSFTGGAVEDVASSITSAITGGSSSGSSSGIGSLIGSAFSGATSGLVGLAKTGADAISSGAATASGLFGAAVGLACDAASTTTGTALDTASSLVSGLASGVSGLTGGLSSHVGFAGDIASGLGGGLSDLAGSLLGGVSDVAGGLADAGTSVAGSLLDSATSLGGSLLDSATGLAGDLLSTGADVGGSLLDAVGDIAGDVGSLAADTVSGMADLAGDALDVAGDLAGDALDMATDLAGDVLDAAGDLAGDALDLAADVAEGVMDAAEAVVDDLADAAMDAVDAIGDAIDEAFDDMEEECDEMGDEFDDDEWDDDWEDEEIDDEDFEDDDYLDEEEMDEDWDKEWDEEVEMDSEGDGSDGGNENVDGTEYYDGSQEPEDSEESEESEGSDEESQQMGDQEESQETTETKEENKVSWRTTPNKWPEDGMLFMIHDGDQQLFNPYGHNTGDWTMFSFIPEDAKQMWPQIAITPSSFAAISSINDMLDMVPYVVVKEYFFKNTASTMINFVKKIFKLVKDSSQPANEEDGGESSGSPDAKKSGDSWLDKIMEKFRDVGVKELVIDIPYALYCGLRSKVYGNTYIFPYIVQSGSTVINQASNASEWGNGEAGEGALGALKNMAMGAVRLIGGLAANLTGSQAKPAEIFPAPSWSGPNGGQKPEFSFELMLINDHIIKARNNYMCVNTIIHNNRSIQKAILSFPGALYEIWLPTGQRHLMCTGEFNLYPLGLNRRAPKRFFNGGSVPGANFEIGSTSENAPIENKHTEKAEVIPDGYKLSVKFQSCIANNMNSSVFQYYVKMAGYDAYSTTNMGGDEVESELNGLLPGFQPAGKQDIDEVQNNGKEEEKPKDGAKGIRKAGSTLQARVEEDDELKKTVEKFYESTFNKSLEKLKSQFGDQTINTESAVLTVKKVQGVIRQSLKFLNKLYGAHNSNLWYKQYEKDELYTSLEPDPRQKLRKQYREKFEELRGVVSEIEQQTKELDKASRELSTKVELEDRNPILERKVEVQMKVSSLMKRKREIEDYLLQKDAELVQAAWDAHDKAVSAKKREITPRIFQQVWNEKIMNAYEKDKLQYLTSEEKVRYFNEKIRELKKYDTYGILNHPDWFFRVAVLDYIVAEMRRLVYWFKNCSYDDFETVYKIIRKLNLLQLDVDCIRSNDEFNVNRTNLFYMSEQNVKDYKKIDEMLVGNTLYELFKSQVRLNFIRYEKEDSGGSEEVKPVVDKELLTEREHEIIQDRQRVVRQDIVARYWGSEAELTRVAYQKVMTDESALKESDKPTIVFDGETKKFNNLRLFKDRIIELKLKSVKTTKENNELQALVGALSNVVTSVKEAMVMDKMNAMIGQEKDEISNAKVQVEAKVI